MSRKSGPPPQGTLSAQNLFAAAVGHHRNGRIAEAERLYRSILAFDPRHADALHYLGVAAMQRGGNAEAIDLIGKSLAANKRNAEAHYHIGLAYAALGRFEDVETHNRRAVSLKPDYAQAHLNLGNALMALGRNSEAADCYRRAIGLSPNAAEAHFNLGNVLSEGRDPEAAISCYERAIALRPDYLQARHNLAAALLLLRRADAAIVQFDRVLAARPDFSDALVGRAVAGQMKGDHAGALKLLCRALTLGQAGDARSIFCECVRALDRVPDIPGLRDFLTAAIAQPWDRPRNLVSFAASMLRADGAVAPVLARFADFADPHRALTQEELSALAGDTLLAAVLENAAMASPDTEAMLTAARRTLLEMAGRPALGGMLGFACALARQCFINEYVFDLDADEAAQADALRTSLASTLAAGTQPQPWLVASAAAYGPLHAVEGCEGLLQWQWPAPLDALLTQQVREPAHERKLRETMPALTAVTQGVSSEVRRQYEENPYPRWINIVPPHRRHRIDDFLRKAFPDAVFRDSGFENPQLLSAGCGTGLYANEFAQAIEGIRVLAVDLSLSSLSYAKRKSEELGVANIVFAQADIVVLPETGRRFDIVETGGVLHHMADPFAAWRGLLSMLKPGGFMRLGFYSEAARKDVVAAREFIAGEGFRADLAGIRATRRALKALTPEHPARGVVRSGDFYTASECRDLIFHVREHRLSIPQIAAFIAAENLTFIGFQLAGMHVAARYAARFPHDRAMTDLGNWDVFEREHPETFAGMYQFWVQKPS